ncbi:MAG: selenide, water dikinase SelD [Rhodospirillales bacterium]|nr:selenide, water dikinase SelD [Rhodospirillales bacterium]
MQKPSIGTGMDEDEIRLTSFSHGGGCGCKIAPAVLNKILAKLPGEFANAALLVGTESSDDAAVYRINDRQAIVATTDFFMPIVDDAFDFGRIAATNALSDVYAVGGRPVLALAIVGMPVDRLPVETIQNILAGGAAVCEAAGIPIAGGHSIDSPEPIYGLAAIGLVDPDHVKRNNSARAGDVLILGKALGIGILSAAMKGGTLDGPGYAEMIETTTRLNSVGADLAEIGGVHAMTDVTGFGLLGHLLEVCRGSGLAARLDMDNIPILPQARALAMNGLNTGAAGRNWESYGHDVTLPGNLNDWQRNILVDPQTSGGLLVSCHPDEAERVLGLFHDQGYPHVTVIGALEAGAAGVTVRG